MIVYYQGRSQNHRMHVQPGVEFPTVSDWREPDGRPKLFELFFKGGKVEVDEQLGKYLIDKKLASKTKIIIKEVE